MTEHKKQRRKMVDNNVRFRTFFLYHGRDFLQEVLEVYTSPRLLHEKLVESEYYCSLSKSNQESLSSIKTGNTFANLELEQIHDLLLNFTQIKPSDNEEENEKKHTLIRDSLELFMSLWDSIKTANVMLDKDFRNNVKTLKNIADKFVVHFAFGKSFRDEIARNFEDMNDRPISIQLVSSGKDVNVQIGQNNKCFLNVEVFDHLQNEAEPTSKNADDDLVKVIIHTSTTSTSGIDVAQIEMKLLRSLSGEQLQEINKDLQEKFGVEIVVARKGCVVLVLQKTQPTASRIIDENVLKELFSVLFELVGFSNDDLSEISLLVDLTLGDYADVNTFKESQLRGKGLELTLSSKSNIKNMSKEKKKELVSTILCRVAGLNPRDDNSEIQIEAHFINDKADIVEEKMQNNAQKLMDLHDQDPDTPKPKKSLTDGRNETLYRERSQQKQITETRTGQANTHIIKKKTRKPAGRKRDQSMEFASQLNLSFKNVPTIGFEGQERWHRLPDDFGIVSLEETESEGNVTRKLFLNCEISAGSTKILPYKYAMKLSKTIQVTDERGISYNLSPGNNVIGRIFEIGATSHPYPVLLLQDPNQFTHDEEDVNYMPILSEQYINRSLVIILKRENDLHCLEHVQDDDYVLNTLENFTEIICKCDSRRTVSKIPDEKDGGEKNLQTIEDNLIQNCACAITRISDEFIEQYSRPDFEENLDCDVIACNSIQREQKRLNFMDLRGDQLNYVRQKFLDEIEIDHSVILFLGIAMIGNLILRQFYS